MDDILIYKNYNTLYVVYKKSIYSIFKKLLDNNEIKREYDYSILRILYYSTPAYVE